VRTRVQKNNSIDNHPAAPRCTPRIPRVPARLWLRFLVCVVVVKRGAVLAVQAYEHVWRVSLSGARSLACKLAACWARCSVWQRWLASCTRMHVTLLPTRNLSPPAPLEQLFAKCVCVLTVFALVCACAGFTYCVLLVLMTPAGTIDGAGSSVARIHRVPFTRATETPTPHPALERRWGKGTCPGQEARRFTCAVGGALDRGPESRGRASDVVGRSAPPAFTLPLCLH